MFEEESHSPSNHMYDLFLNVDGRTRRDRSIVLQICMALFVIILLVSAMIGSVGWLWLAKRIGKFGAWQAMNFVGAATNLTFFFIGEGQSYRVLAAGALNGVPVGA